MEPPTVRDATLSLAKQDPFADTLEVFLRDQPLTDDVVHVAGEPLP